MEKSEIQSEALVAIGNKQRAGVVAGTGSGKTLIGIRHMSQGYSDYSRFLVVGPKKAVFKAWIEDMDKFNMSHLKDHVKFSTYLSLNKQDLDYDAIYLDEVHNLKLSHDTYLSQFKGKLLGLTGTPPKNNKSERGHMMEKYCPIVFTYKTDNAVADGILNDYRIVVYYLNLDQTKTIKMQKGESVWYTSEQASYDYWTNQIEYASSAKVHMTRLMRMKAMQAFPSKEVLAGKILNAVTDKCLLFVNTKDQADRLCTHSYHSGNPISENNLSLFKEDMIDKLSAVQQLSESINIPNLKEGIIMHAFGNERVASQKIGRMLRLNPKDTSTIRILCYRNTVDEEWVKLALADFDQSKISYK